MQKTLSKNALLLAFNAGFINSTTLVGTTHLAVSHVTGNVTLFAVAWVQGDWAFFALVCATLLAFLFGAVMAGFALSYGVYARWLFLGQAGLLLLALIILWRGHSVGQVFAAMACGLQNATSYLTQGVRTTHLTGLSTDMGISLGKWLAGKGRENQLKRQTLIWYAYCGGASFGAWVYFYVAYWGLWLPILVLLGVGIFVKDRRA